MRLLGQFLETRYSAAEGILGAVAVVLIVWLLWPEERRPQLDQHASWQESVEQAEQRRVELEAGRAAGSAGEARIARQATAAEAPARIDDVRRPAEPERRRIARPSEFADRHSGDQRRLFQPGPKRPLGSGDQAVAATLPPQPDVAPESEQEATASPSSVATADTVRDALSDMVSSLTIDSAVSADPVPGKPAVDAADSDAPALNLAALPSEGLALDPLPDVDLSDLDALAPPTLGEQATAALVDPAPDAAIAPALVGPDPGATTNDVSERPRDDAPTWLRNAVTTAVADQRPIIAVVIDDLGLNRSNTAALNDLPRPLTLAFLPYAGRIEAQTQAARAAGHELMLHLPMEPLGSDWPGPDALTTRIDQDEFVARLVKNLDRFQGFVGINNHMGSRLTADRPRMDLVMRELRKRDVLFLDSKTSARSVAGEAAGRNGVPNTTRDIFLDHVIDKDAIRRQLARAETVARRTGSAVAIGHPHNTTIQALREWLPSLESRGFALAPISAVVARRACSSGVLIAADTCGLYLQAQTPAQSPPVAKDG